MFGIKMPKTKKAVEEKPKQPEPAVGAADKAEQAEQTKTIVTQRLEQQKQPEVKEFVEVSEAKKKAPAGSGGIMNSMLLFAVAISMLILGLLIGGIANGGLAVVGLVNIEISVLVLLLIAIFMMALGGVIIGLLEAAFFKWKAPEAYFFLNLRMGKKIMVRVHHFNGREFWLAGVLSRNGLTIEFMGKVVCIDPKMLGEGKNSYCNGVEIIDVAANNLMAFGTIDALGIFTVEEYFRDPKNHYDDLTRYDDSIIMFLYSLPESELGDNCSIWVSVDPSTITWAEIVQNNLVLDPRKKEETDEEFKKRYMEAYAQQFEPQEGEEDSAYQARIKPFFDRVKQRKINEETAKLKEGIIRLKRETEKRILTSRVFTYHAAAKAMDVRLAIEAYDRLEAIITAEKPNQKAGVPEWVKAIGIIIALGLMVLLVLAGIKMVIG